MQSAEPLMSGWGARAVRPHNAIARIVRQTVAFLRAS